MLAGKEAKVTLCGNATFRLPEFPGGIAPAAILRKIEPGELADMTLVVDGARAGWGLRNSPTNILKSAKERTALVLSASQFVVNRSDDGSLTCPAKRAAKSEGRAMPIHGKKSKQR
jgi:hypothetical protein